MENVVLSHIKREETNAFTEEEINDLLVKYFHRNYTNSLDSRNDLVALYNRLKSVQKAKNENAKKIEYVTNFITKKENTTDVKTTADLLIAKQNRKDIEITIKEQDKELSILNLKWYNEEKNLIQSIIGDINPNIHHPYTQSIINKALILFKNNKAIKKTHVESRIGVNTSDNLFKGLNNRKCNIDKDCDSLNLLLTKNKYTCNPIKKQCEKTSKSNPIRHKIFEKNLLFKKDEPVKRLTTSFRTQSIPVGLIRPSRPSVSARQSRSARPSGPAKPAVSTRQSGSARLSRSARPSGPAKQSVSTRQSRSARPSRSARLSRISESTESMRPSGSISPGGPIRRVGPVGFGRPVRPVGFEESLRSKGGNHKK